MLCLPRLDHVVGGTKVPFIALLAYRVPLLVPSVLAPPPLYVGQPAAAAVGPLVRRSGALSPPSRPRSRTFARARACVSHLSCACVSASVPPMFTTGFSRAPVPTAFTRKYINTLAYIWITFGRDANGYTGTSHHHVGYASRPPVHNYVLLLLSCPYVIRIIIIIVAPHNYRTHWS